jgi:hypothetical protein
MNTTLKNHRKAAADLLWYDRRRLPSQGEHRFDFCELENWQRGGPPHEGFAHIAAIVVANTSVTESAQLHIDGLEHALPASTKDRLSRSGKGCLVVPAGTAKLLLNRGVGWSIMNKQNAVITLKNTTAQEIEYCIVILGSADLVPVPCCDAPHKRTSG